MENNEENILIYKMKEKDKKAVSFIWILPLIIFFILSWIAYESYMKKGTMITVSFKSAEGIKENVTPLEYKGLQLGKVSKISISKDLKKVDVKILVKSDVAQYVASESSRFWIKKPTVSLTKVSGLSTLISGHKIELSPKFRTQEEFDNGKEQYYFQGLDSKPDDDLLSDGYYVHLVAIGKNMVEVGTPIFYNNFQIGEVVSKDFKNEKLYLNTYIYDKFNYLVNKSSQFVLNEALNVTLGASGLNVQLSSFYSAIVGGISVITADKKARKIKEDEINILYTNKKELEDKLKQIKKQEDIKISLYSDNLNSISKNSKVYYKNIQIGKVIDYKLSKDLKKVKIDISIDEKYKNIVNNHSLFYDMSSKLIEIKNLNLNFNYSGIEPLLNGSIGLLSEKRSETLSKKEFKLYSSYKDVEKLKKIYNQGFLIDAYFDNKINIKENMSVVYKNQEIGFVKSISFKESKSKASLFIYKKFKKYISKKSRFYKKSLVNFNASLSGIIFEIDNFTSFLEGSIYLDNKAKTFYDKYKIFASEENMKKSSHSIKILFDEVEGVEKNFSKLKYKGVEVGKVINISFNKAQKIELEVFIYDDFKSFARKGSIYYLKKPRVSLQELANANSLFRAVNIGVIKSSSKKYKSKFIGYDKKPIDLISSEGIVFKVEDHFSSNIGVNSPIYYKNVQIGKVLKVDLSLDASYVLIDCLIYDKYKKFIRKNSSFYDISGFEMEFSLFDKTKVKSNTITSILKGGLLVVTPLKYKKIANHNDRFILKKDLEKNWKDISPSIK